VVGSVQLSGGATTYSIPVNLAQNAANTFTVTATDRRGNQSRPPPSPPSRRFQRPRVPTITSPTAPVTVNATTYTISGTADAGPW